jgi:thioredoxin-dependent peroxiredoxin
LQARCSGPRYLERSWSSWPRSHGTPGAIAREHLPDYDEAGAVVVGVSPDPVGRVTRFHDRQHLNFRLLADEDHSVSETYGVWVEKSMYGKTFWGTQRATFIIDPEGTVAHVIPKVSPKTHDDEVLSVLRRQAPLRSSRRSPSARRVSG